MIAIPDVFSRLYNWDFFLVTVLTIMAPILCFILALRYEGRRLFKFLCHSTALYATLSPVTTLAVFGYLLTGKARFLVTGDADASMETDASTSRPGLFQRVNKSLSETHPDHRTLQLIEFFAGLAFLAVAIFTFQIAFIGLALGFMLMPFMHNFGWDNKFARVMVWVPFSMILVGISMGGLGMFGVYPVMFGYGFHF